MGTLRGMVFLLQTCGAGEKSRSRLVSLPASNGRQACEEEAMETLSCNEAACIGTEQFSL